MMHLGDFPTSATVQFKWSTNGSNGASITRATDGTLKIYKGASTTERSSLNGVTQTEDFDSATGIHHVTIDLSDNTDASFYAAGNEYQVVMTGMSIDSQTVNAVIGMFSIERAGGILALLKDATYGLSALETLVDDLESRLGTPSNLGGGATIAANLADIEAQTDDIGTAGAGLTAVPWNASWDAEVQSEVDDALVAQNLDHLVKIAVDTNFATTVHLDSVLGQLADNGSSATFDRTTDSLEAQRDNLGTNGAALSAVAWNAAWDAEVQSEVADALDAAIPGSPTSNSINERLQTMDNAYTATRAGYLDNINNSALATTAAQTGDSYARIGSAGVSLSNIPWNASWDAEVQSEVQDAIEVNNLDHLVKAAVDTDFQTTVHLNSVIGHLADNGTSATFDRTTDSQEAIRDVESTLDTTLNTIATYVDTEVAAIYSRLGAPAGASMSADVAAIKAQTAAIETDTQDLQSRVPAALTAGGNIKADSLAISGSTTAADNLEQSTVAIAYGTVGSGSTTTSIVTSAMSPSASVADQFKGKIVTFSATTATAALRSQSTDITASTSGGTMTVTALTTAPSSGDVFCIT